MNIFSRLFPKATIVFYHRIAEPKNDPHELSVAPEHFDEHLAYYKKHFNVMRLDEIAEAIKNKSMPNRALAITFDDGYADNLHTALPLLERHNLPATFFITSGYIGSSEPFFWDKDTPAEDRGRALTSDEVLQLAKSSVVDIGAHTVHHPILSSLDAEGQRAELRDSKSALEKLLGREIHGLAYPFGGNHKFDDITIREAQASGYSYALTTIPRRVKNSSDLFQLPRFCIKDWGQEQLHEHLTY